MQRLQNNSAFRTILSISHAEGASFPNLFLSLASRNRYTNNVNSRRFPVHTKMWWKLSETWNQHGLEYVRENFPSHPEWFNNPTAELAKFPVTQLQRPSVCMNRGNGSPFTWEKISKSKFGLTSRMVRQPNGGTREVPCYSLTKTAWTGVPRSHEAVKSCKVANCMRFSDWGAGDDRVICPFFLPFFFDVSKCLFIFAIDKTNIQTRYEETFLIYIIAGPSFAG